MKRLLICTLTIIFLGCGEKKQNKSTKAESIPVKEVPSSLNDEVFYHVFQRSFFDTNNDGHGDLNGITAKLDYLEDLGITSVLMVPLYSSIYYHNYFADDFYKIDEEYGTLEDYQKLVKSLHEKDMRLYMDMEIHYVTKNHIWFKDSYRNPDSEYSNHVIYNGKNNTDPESMIFGLHSLKSYDGEEVNITTIDLSNPEVKSYLYDLFKYWVDPDKDGDYSDGVDGFRIDHMMDDLDGKGINTDLLSTFWKPLIAELKSMNPDLIIVAEQADWTDLGSSYFTKSDVDAMFGFSLREALTGFKKKSIVNKTKDLLEATPVNKYQLLFLENHDTDRYATLVDEDMNKLKFGAAYTILTKGVPLIYYGQEIGMKGDGGFGKFGMTDGNDIPMREAFEWYESVDGPGMAMWYRDSGPWWDNSNLANNDGISLAEQIDDPESLWSFYQSLLKIKKKHKAFRANADQLMITTDDDIIAIRRQADNETFLLLFNTSDEVISYSSGSLSSAQLVLKTSGSSMNVSEGSITLGPYGFALINLQ